MRGDGLPQKPLKLLAGLRWQGKLTVTGRKGDKYTVAFDAEGIDSGEKQYVFDRACLTAQELEDWTGWREEKRSGGAK